MTTPLVPLEEPNVGPPVNTLPLSVDLWSLDEVPDEAVVAASRVRRAAREVVDVLRDDSQYLNLRGLWNDPGSGKFARRGFSTEKARRFAERRDLMEKIRGMAKRAGKFRVTVRKDQFPSARDGWMDAEFHDDKFARVFAPDGRAFLVGWEAVEDIGARPELPETMQPSVDSLRDAYTTDPWVWPWVRSLDRFDALDLPEDVMGRADAKSMEWARETAKNESTPEERYRVVTGRDYGDVVYGLNPEWGVGPVVDRGLISATLKAAPEDRDPDVMAYLQALLKRFREQTPESHVRLRRQAEVPGEGNDAARWDPTREGTSESTSGVHSWSLISGGAVAGELMVEDIPTDRVLGRVGYIDGEVLVDSTPDGRVVRMIEDWEPPASKTFSVPRSGWDDVENPDGLFQLEERLRPSLSAFRDTDRWDALRRFSFKIKSSRRDMTPSEYEELQTTPPDNLAVGEVTPDDMRRYARYGIGSGNFLRLTLEQVTKPGGPSEGSSDKVDPDALTYMQTVRKHLLNELPEGTESITLWRPKDNRGTNVIGAGSNEVTAWNLTPPDDVDETTFVSEEIPIGRVFGRFGLRMGEVWVAAGPELVDRFVSRKPRRPENTPVNRFTFDGNGDRDFERDMLTVDLPNDVAARLNAKSSIYRGARGGQAEGYAAARDPERVAAVMEMDGNVDFGSAGATKLGKFLAHNVDRGLISATLKADDEDKDPDVMAYLKELVAATEDMLDKSQIRLYRGADIPGEGNDATKWSRERSKSRVSTSGVHSWTIRRDGAAGWGQNVMVEDIPKNRVIGRFGTVDGEYLVDSTPDGSIVAAIKAWEPPVPFGDSPEADRAVEILGRLPEHPFAPNGRKPMTDKQVDKVVDTLIRTSVIYSGGLAKLPAGNASDPEWVAARDLLAAKALANGGLDDLTTPPDDLRGTVGRAVRRLTDDGSDVDWLGDYLYEELTGAPYPLGSRRDPRHTLRLALEEGLETIPRGRIGTPHKDLKPTETDIANLNTVIEAGSVLLDAYRDVSADSPAVAISEMPEVTDAEAASARAAIDEANERVIRAGNAINRNTLKRAIVKHLNKTAASGIQPEFAGFGEWSDNDPLHPSFLWFTDADGLEWEVDVKPVKVKSGKREGEPDVVLHVVPVGEPMWKRGVVVRAGFPGEKTGLIKYAETKDDASDVRADSGMVLDRAALSMGQARGLIRGYAWVAYTGAKRRGDLEGADPIVSAYDEYLSGRVDDGTEVLAPSPSGFNPAEIRLPDVGGYKGVKLGISKLGGLTLTGERADGAAVEAQIIRSYVLDKVSDETREALERGMNRVELERTALLEERFAEGRRRRDARVAATDGWIRDVFATGREPKVSAAGPVGGATATKVQSAVARVFPSRLVDAMPEASIDVLAGRRAFYSRGARGTNSTSSPLAKLAYSGTDSQGTMVHEYGHHVESNNLDIAQALWVFYRSRTEGEELRPLRELHGGGAYGSGEKTREDKFFVPYAGKDYGQTMFRPTDAYDWSSELFTVGLEGVFHPDGRAEKIDDQYAAFILGILLMVSGRKQSRNGRTSAPMTAPLGDTLDPTATIEGDV